jgi:hypothetical protein
MLTNLGHPQGHRTPVHIIYEHVYKARRFHLVFAVTGLTQACINLDPFSMLADYLCFDESGQRAK